MKPGYNTNGLAHHRLEEALDLIAATGFEVVALTLDVFHLDPLRATAAEVQVVGKALRVRCLEVVVETGGRFLLDPVRKHRPNLLEEDPEQRARRLDLLRNSLAIARDLGASTLSLWSGAVPEGVLVDRAWSRLLDGLARLGEAARSAGVALALEPEPGHLVGRVEDWRRVRDLLGACAPKLCLDVGHLVCQGEGLPAEVLRPEEGGRIGQVHLEDVRSGRHEHLEPGEGEVDFPSVFQQLRALEYTGPVCWELNRSSHRAPEALQRAWRSWCSAGARGHGDL